jgi:hypothetical protein
MIEQKKKLCLDELQVESFTTKFDTAVSEQTNDIKGGGGFTIYYGDYNMCEPIRTTSSVVTF